MLAGGKQVSVDTAQWGKPDPKLEGLIDAQFQIALDVYEADPKLLTEHANQEDSFRTGGYAERQLFELVQNAADAILRGDGRGRIELRLTEDTLYCANEGAAFDAAGIDAVTHAYLSEKRGDEIGRFGLGFKSVLSVTENAQVHSRSVSFEFNSARAKLALTALAPDEPRLPEFRIPTLLDSSSAMDQDPVLRELAEWATTVIKMPRVMFRSRLEEQVTTFQTEFLLFANTVKALRIVVSDASGTVFDQEHRCESLGEETFEITTPAGVSEKWLVAEKQHLPSLAARTEVGEALARQDFKISYAAPLAKGGSVGQFWAYFPLRDQTTATGAFNAPWAVSDDRTTLLEGKYNREILESFVGLFVGCLPRLSKSSDPASHFDYMPSRTRETLSPADLILSTQIPLAAAAAGLIPDANADLKIGSDLKPLAFEVDVNPESMRRWQEASHTPTDVPHYRCYLTAQRRLRLRELFINELGMGKDEKAALAAVPQIGIATWLTQLASSAQLPDAALALKIALDVPADARQAARLGLIIPTSDGHFATLSDRSSVFLGGAVDEATGAEFKFVRQDFLESAGVHAALVENGYAKLDGETGFRSMLRRTEEDWKPSDWDRLWNLALDVPTSRAVEMIAKHVANHHPIRVMTKAGTWSEPEYVVDLESAGIDLHDDSRAFDPSFHERALGRAAGVIVGVSAKYPVIEEDIFDEYKAWAQDSFQKKAAIGGGIVSRIGRFAEEYAPGPISILKELAEHQSPEGQLQWSSMLLRPDADRTWKMIASDGSNHELIMPAPHIWAVEKFGLIATHWGPRRAALSLHPALMGFGPFLPVALSDGSKRLSLIESIEDVPLVIWREMLNRSIDVSEGNGGTVSALSALVVAGVRALPELESVPLLPAAVGRSVESTIAEDVKIARTAEEDLYLEKQGKPRLFIADRDEADMVALRTGARLASDALTFSLHFEGESDPEPIVDRFFGLRDLGNELLNETKLIRCSTLAKRVTTDEGFKDEPVKFAKYDGALYVVSGVDDVSLLTWVSQILRLGLGAHDIDHLLQVAMDAEVEALEAATRSAGSDTDRIRLLFSKEELESCLPPGLVKSLEAFGVNDSNIDLAKLFFDVYGYESLKTMQVQLDQKRLPVPRDWAGSSAALRLVKRLGFDSKFAGERGRSLPKTLTVLGKPGLDDLHEYQLEIAEQIRNVLISDRDGSEAKKAMVELPTGAGKTRVTVEAIIRAFLANEIEGPILWIAQSDELCEQAVQTWSEVWRQYSDNRTLTIGRLWAENEVPEPDTTLSVVVATDAKLEKLQQKIEYEWLSRPCAVIVDEAHVAGVSKRYTDIFKWLGVDGRSHDRPLLGLSATPFKGRSEEGTKRLIARFDGNLIDIPGGNAYEFLQNMGVLAHVDHQILPGASLTLTDGELADISQYSRLNANILERLATDEDRTKRLVDSIQSLDPTWPVLVFTSSVLSAQIVATLLKTRGISAASVSGETGKHERRRIISDFRAGSIRVLVNCQVLTQGFDAPEVRALYIARPTLSPNAYIQMAGRGLRGELNGGSKRCLIVDLADSFLNYNGDLAFREFEDLWKRMQDAS